jgi:hypothetical protein
MKIKNSLKKHSKNGDFLLLMIIILLLALKKNKNLLWETSDKKYKKITKIKLLLTSLLTMTFYYKKMLLLKSKVLINKLNSNSKESLWNTLFLMEALIKLFKEYSINLTSGKAKNLPENGEATYKTFSFSPKLKIIWEDSLKCYLYSKL